VKAIHDKAAMLQAAARVAGNVVADTRCYEIRWRAAKKGGVISKGLPKIIGDIQSPRNGATEPKGDVLKKAGVSSQEASRWERLSDVPEDQFEAALATKSVRDLIDKPRPVSDDALLFIGTMRDFERRGYLARTPANLMTTQRCHKSGANAARRRR
jgi:hypothetical protein